jgi:hypothetical protein
MQFEFKNALTDLDQKTPTYFRDEIFHHGDLTARREAIKALGDLDTRQHTVRVLREIIRIV